MIGIYKAVALRLAVERSSFMRECSAMGLSADDLVPAWERDRLSKNLRELMALL